MKEFYLGLMVGLVQTGIGHPLDTIKTNYQNKNKLELSKNRIQTLYRGIRYPMIASVMTNGCLFYSNKYKPNSIHRYTRKYFINSMNYITINYNNVLNNYIYLMIMRT